MLKLLIFLISFLLLISCNKPSKKKWYSSPKTDSSWVKNSSYWVDKTAEHFLDSVSVEQAESLKYLNLVHYQNFSKSFSDSISIERIILNYHAENKVIIDRINKRLDNKFQQSLIIENSKGVLNYEFSDSNLTHDFVIQVKEEIVEIEAYERKLEQETSLVRRCGTDSPINILKESIWEYPKSLPIKISMEQAQNLFLSWKLDSILKL